MNLRSRASFAWSGAIVIVLLACSFSSARITEIAFATSIGTDRAPLVKLDRFFKHDGVLHCCVKLAHVPSETKVKAVWRHHSQGSGIIPIDSIEISARSDGWVDFSFTAEKQGLPYGDYSVNIFLNGVFHRTAPFAVVKQYRGGAISEAVIASNVNADFFPTALQSAFPPQVKIIYAPTLVFEAPEGSRFSAVWYQHFDKDERVKLVASDFSGSGSGWIGFSLRPKAPLPVGEYSVDLLMNGGKLRTLAFLIR